MPAAAAWMTGTGFVRTPGLEGQFRGVLAIQDTTAINYNGLEATRGFVGLGGPGKGVKGLMAHFGLAVNLVGRPLGVFSLDAEIWTSWPGPRHRLRPTRSSSRT